MEKKINCWEYMKCGREPGGKNVKEFGVCPVIDFKKSNGLNHGKNAGRVCWVISGTFCDGEVQGRYSEKILKCMKCDFFIKVRKEEMESNSYVKTQDLMKKIR